MDQDNPLTVLRERLIAEHSMQFGDRDDNYGKGAAACFTMATRLIDEMQPITVLPCPFCGGTDIRNADNRYMFCYDCEADGPVDGNGRAIEVWNKRA